MVRVAGLRGQVRSGVATPSQDGLTPQEQLTQDRRRGLGARLRPAAALARTEGRPPARGHRPRRRRRPDEGRGVLARGLFPAPRLPRADAARRSTRRIPFPFIPNLGSSIALKLARQSDGKVLNALIRLPSQVERFIRLPDFAETGATRFIALEQVDRAATRAGSFPATTCRGRAASGSSATATSRSRKRPRISCACSRRRSSSAGAAASSASRSRPAMPEDLRHLRRRGTGNRPDDDDLRRRGHAGPQRAVPARRPRPAGPQVQALQSALPRAHPRA